MCDICDGKTYEELWSGMQARIEAGGWALQGVAPSGPGRGWVYTIGLVESFGHPELVVTHSEPAAYASLLNEIGDRIRRGERFDVGSGLDLDGYLVEFGAVHPSYLTGGLMASWVNYYGWTGAPPATLDALQVVLPLAKWCERCDRIRRCLAWPGGLDVGDGPNRMARRASMRRRDRRR